MSCLSPHKKNISVVTVTYGTRWHLLSNVLEGIRTQTYPINDILIVNNGSHDQIEQEVEQLKDSRIRIIKLDYNRGSAVGFSAGLMAALQKNCDFIWLLDDDNKPRSDALSKLLQSYELLGSNCINALVATRYVNGSTRGIATLSKPGSFLGFHIINLPKEITKKILTVFIAKSEYSLCSTNSKKPKNTYDECPLKQIDTAPYGGLLLHKKLIRLIGLPREDFVTYADDTEYTMRISQHGGNIYLCGPSLIDDIEPSWSLRRGKANPLILEGVSSYRLYYGIRNHCFLDFHASTWKWVFFCSMIVRVTVLAINGLLFEKNKKAFFKNLQVIFHAVRDGINGKLGRCEKYEGRE